jgi:trans-aconitate methyltransferase
VPPNCKFEVDDYEQDWTFRQKFDFIHGRELEGSIRDHDELFVQCFKNLRPGGYLEMQSMEVATYSDDGSHHKATNLQEFIRNLLKAAETFNKRMDSIPAWKEKMEKAGFKDINVRVYKVRRPPE